MGKGLVEEQSPYVFNSYLNRSVTQYKIVIMPNYRKYYEEN